MRKIVLMQTTPTGTTLKWVEEGQVLHLAGRSIPAQWLQVLRDLGYTIRQA